MHLHLRAPERWDPSPWYPVGGAALLAFDFGAGLYLTTATWRSELGEDPPVGVGDPLAIGLGVVGLSGGAVLGASMTDSPRKLVANGIASQIGGIGGSAVGVTGLLVHILGCDGSTDAETDRCVDRGVRFLTTSIGTGALLGGVGAVAAMAWMEDSKPSDEKDSVQWIVVPGGVVGVF